MNSSQNLYRRWFGFGAVIGTIAAPIFYGIWLTYYALVPAAALAYQGSPAVIVTNPVITILGTDIPVNVPSFLALIALTGGIGGGLLGLAAGRLSRLPF